MIDVDILCNPYLGEPLKRVGDHLVGLASGVRFLIKEDIPIIIDRPHFSVRNKLNNFLYNVSAGVYEKLLNIGDRIDYSKDIAVNKHFLNNLKIESGQKVLEIGIGTGLSTRFLPDNIEHIGLDLSWNMLQQATKNMTALNRTPLLVQALAEYLPFRDNSMDVVFQIGTLQFTEDPFRSVSEMARVAKPGTTIFILDEISGGMKIFQRSPAHKMHVNNTKDLIRELPRLVPHSMINIKSQNFLGTQFYQLQFSKPK